MTEEEVEAIEIAYNHYKRSPLSCSELDKPEYKKAWSWEKSVVLSMIQVETVFDREGAHLVYDKEGLLVPQFGLVGDLAGVYDDSKGERLITQASGGDQVAHKVLCYFAAGFVKSGCSMPSRLRGYIAAELESQAEEPPQRRRGQDPYANNTRNFEIALTVCRVVGLGFRPTRNRATEAASACSITAQALAKSGLHMSESAVEKIWGQFAPAFREAGS